jgi:hypothetical protein
MRGSAVAASRRTGCCRSPLRAGQSNHPKCRGSPKLARFSKVLASIGLFFSGKTRPISLTAVQHSFWFFLHGKGNTSLKSAMMPNIQAKDENPNT